MKHLLTCVLLTILRPVLDLLDDSYLVLRSGHIGRADKKCTKDARKHEKVATD